MACCSRLVWQRRLATVLISIAMAAALVVPAGATMKFGTVQLSGNLETQNAIRHASPSSAQLVQNRNTLRLRLDWDWVDRGRFMDRMDVPFIKRSKFFLLYRGVYDGFYDLAPGDRQRGVTRYDDLVGGPIEGNPYGTCKRTDSNPTGSCNVAGAELRDGLYSRLSEGSRNSVKFENRIREAYIDLKLEDAPLSFRVGRQQVIWGESDQFRLMDIWNPLDLSWHIVHEPFEQIRVPLWLIKGLYDIGDLGPLSNTFLEVVYNAFDFQPGTKVKFLPHPWGAPFPDPTRCLPVSGHPDSRVVCGGQIQTLVPEETLATTGLYTRLDATGLPTGSLLGTPVFNLQNTSARRGDFHRNPAEASEIGWRFHGVTEKGVEFTANHLYGRSRGIGAIAGTPWKLKIQSATVLDTIPEADNVQHLGRFENIPVVPIYIRAEYMHPYSHIFGFTANYFEGDYTQAVLRLETAYQLGAAVQTVEPSKRVPVRLGEENTGIPSSFLAPLGFDKRNVWAGMIGFDRPTWLRFLNPRGTWLLSGQVFWSYIDGNVSYLREAHQTAGEYPYFTPATHKNTPGSLSDDGVGKWTSGPFAGLTERVQDGTFDGNQDAVRRWESLITMAMTSFYRGGTLVPFIALAWDPGNENFNANLDLQYFYTNDLVFMVQQKYFTDFDKDTPSLDPWGVGGLNNRRDETILKVTYQF